MTTPWLEEYKRLWLANKMKKFAAFYQTCDNPLDYLRIPKHKTANGLTQLIIKFLTFKGHYANRISTQGQARVEKHRVRTTFNGEGIMADRVTWTPGTTKRGTPDVSAIINGRAVWIEVKIGTDKMSAAQLAQQEHIVDAGGLYYIARTMEGFYNWYNSTFNIH